MTAPNKLHYASLLEVSEQLRARELSPVELTQATLARIERLNPSLGAYYAVFAEAALAEALQAEAEIAEGTWRGPLHGVPIAFKDLYSLGPTTAGSKLLAGHVAANEAAAVSRARAAGAVIVGKLATHEFALAAATLSDHFPPARNPWDPDRTPGGSSTGAGVAVAAGLAFGAFGTDTGGSVRLPASHCGVVGYKPTYGLISLAGVIPLAPSLDHAGPLARTVADATAMFAAVCGHDPDDPGSSTRQIAIGPKDLTGGIRGLRIGVPRDFWEPTCEPAVRARFEAALVSLEEMGARVTEAPLGLTLLQIMAVGYVITLTEAAAYQLPNLRSHPDELGREFGLAMRAGLLVPDRAYRAALKARARMVRQIDTLLEDHDVLAMPTVGVLADPLPAGPRPLWRRITGNPAPQYTWLANVHGGPAVSVPCGLAPEGLPVGLQLMGRSYEDLTVLRAAHAYEQAAGWGQMRSDLWP
jgi:aspartyl-tRNA(Asn)/glutamyl-tRNA(Gln) amidotransferase subunit A